MADEMFDSATHKRGPECIDDPTNSGYQVFFAAWSWTPESDGSTIWVNYRMWKANVWLPSSGGDVPAFADNSVSWSDIASAPTDPRKSAPLMDGYRKWDGCTQWTMDDDWSDSDNAEDLEALFRAIRRTHIIAAEIMGDAWEEGETR